MNKKELLEGHNKEEQILISKMIDKMEEAKQKNKLTNTDFLDGYQIRICTEILNKAKFNNYIFFGGYEEAERKIIVFYPDKFKFIIEDKKYMNKLCAIRISLPNELYGTYTHKNYLGMIMKLGVVREKIGDILVKESGADVIVMPEIVKYLLTNLRELTRLRKADIKEIQINELEKVEIKTKALLSFTYTLLTNIIVSALRLDNIIAELAKTSRMQAKELINQERVFVNFKNEIKQTKLLNEGDLISIRGKGRFKISEIIGNTQKGRYILKIEKYV